MPRFFDNSENNKMSFDKGILSRIVEAFIGVAVLTVGSLTYIRYRSESLLMFDWFRDIGLAEYIDNFRNKAEMPNMYGWVKYNMPAGLWLFAYMFVIDSIWGKDKNNVYMYFLYALPLLAIVSEFMQYVGMLSGTFDFMDLLSYVSSIFLFILI